MLTFLNKNRFHIMIWALMLLYLAFAPFLYSQFFLQDGKPIRSIIGELPVEVDEDENEYSIDDIVPVIYDGQDLYQIRGWAFLHLDPSITPEMYVREIVLTSGSRIYYFSTISVQRQGVHDLFFKDFNMNLINSGFSTLVAKEVLRLGKYSVGIVFRYPPCDCEYYITTNRVVIRTSDQLKLYYSKSAP